MSNEPNSCLTCRWAEWHTSALYADIGRCNFPVVLPAAVHDGDRDILVYGVNRRTPFTDCPAWEAKEKR